MRALVLVLALVSGCTFKNSGGQCIGFMNSEQRQAGVGYKMATENLFWATVLTPVSIVFPVIILGLGFECPKEKAK